ncbi:MAG: EAL domain-containing protein [Gammaproteobacteria bacterium]|nr:EAL domain-containing protein [Gammaproteobacteria bacterium]
MQTSSEIKRALDHDSPVLILYVNPDEADAPLEEINQLASAFSVPVALFADLENPEELAKALARTPCFVINSAEEDLLTDSVSRLIKNSEINLNHERQQQYLEELEHRYNLLLDSSRDAIAYVHEGLHVYTNRAYLEALGMKDDSEVAGLSLLEMLDAGETNLKTFFKGLSKGQFPTEALEVKVARPDDTRFEAKLVFSPARFDGEDCIQMMMQRNDSANELAAELERLRKTDPLTRLHNRKAFSEILDECIATGPARDAAAVLYIESDGIDGLQDELTDETMDEFLVDLAGIIQQAIEEGDTAARVSDHSFAVLVHRNSNAQLEQAGEDILAAYRGHIVEIGERALSASCSIGMSTVGRLAMNSPEILARARKAQAEAAVSGDSLVIYRPQLTAVESLDGEQEWLERIKFALGNQDFYSVQQSIVDLDGEGEQMMENITFMRGENGDHPPLDYQAVADRMDLAGTIDRNIIPGLLKTFVDSEERQIISVSNNSIIDYSFPGWFADQMKASCTEGDRVILQIAANAAQTNLRPAQRLMKELKPLGCHLAISLFDAERRSLQLLEHLDISYVKIHPSLTNDLTANTKNQESVSKIVEAAEAHDVLVIADEIEDTSSLAVLWQSGVKLIAGAFLRESSQVLAN